ncbi:hypothetical protein PROFUN_16758, partial [Planoprotostelium fungivorum]
MICVKSQKVELPTTCVQYAEFYKINTARKLPCLALHLMRVSREMIILTSRPLTNVSGIPTCR